MIVSELKGGLGNQMFQYAIGRQLAILHNTDLLLDTKYLEDRAPRENFTFRELNLDIFHIDLKPAPESISKKYALNRSKFWKIIDRLPMKKALKILNEERFSFNPEILKTGDNTYLKGYWQTEKYFSAIEAVIRKDFTIKTEQPLFIQNLRAEILNENAVCVHVRRGDFLKTSLHPTAGIEYYKKAETFLKEQVDNPVYYVFSDEINWCKNNISFEGRVEYVEDIFAGEKSSGHFSLMCACKHFIIPNSSFSWWAAWLGNNQKKIVTAPQIWFEDKAIDTRDLLPAAWIKI